jgi:hypothetical protein
MHQVTLQYRAILGIQEIFGGKQKREAGSGKTHSPVLEIDHPTIRPNYGLSHPEDHLDGELLKSRRTF